MAGELRNPNTDFILPATSSAHFTFEGFADLEPSGGGDDDKGGSPKQDQNRQGGIRVSGPCGGPLAPVLLRYNMVLIIFTIYDVEYLW